MNKLSVEKNDLLQKEVDVLYKKVATHVFNARSNVVKSINTEMVKAYYLIGRDIVLHEQQGEVRAEYGKRIIKEVSKRLQSDYKRGFSIRTLFGARKFYVEYQEVTCDKKVQTLSAKFDCPEFNPKLSWSHYIELMSISSVDKRNFYEIETAKNNWSVRELRNQISGFLFERLVKNKKSENIIKLATEGQEISVASDVIKDPIVLDFLK